MSTIDGDSKHRRTGSHDVVRGTLLKFLRYIFTFYSNKEEGTLTLESGDKETKTIDNKGALTGVREREEKRVEALTGSE